MNVARARERNRRRIAELRAELAGCVGQHDEPQSPRPPSEWLFGSPRGSAIPAPRPAPNDTTTRGVVTDVARRRIREEAEAAAREQLDEPSPILVGGAVVVGAIILILLLKN